MSGSNSGGEKRPEPGGGSIEQMADSSQQIAIEGAGKPADDAAHGQNKNQPMTAPPARAGQPKNQRASNKEAFLDRSLQKQIGSVLRDSFADIEKEALPERLQDLIKALQAKERPRR